MLPSETEDHADHYDHQEQGLGHVLALYGAQLDRVLGKRRAGSVELLAYQGVIAGRDEERQLVDHRGSRYLDRAGGEPGLREDQGFGVEGAEVEIGRRPLPHHYAVDARDEAELVVGEVADVVFLVVVGLADPAGRLSLTVSRAIDISMARQHGMIRRVP